MLNDLSFRLLRYRLDVGIDTNFTVIDHLFVEMMKDYPISPHGRNNVNDVLTTLRSERWEGQDNDLRVGFWNYTDLTKD